MELSYKDTVMFYQTGLRNVGLYTSISLALLGSSRFYRGKGNSVYNIAFLIISVVALLLAISLLRNLISNKDHIYLSVEFVTTLGVLLFFLKHLSTKIKIINRV